MDGLYFYFIVLFVVLSLASPQEFLPACDVVSTIKSLPVSLAEFYVKANISYMNSATLGPMPRSALKCSVSVWEDFEQDPLDKYPWGNDQALDEVRSKSAYLLGADVGEIILTPSTTIGLNLVGEGLVSTKYLTVGSSNILTTDQEHGGGLAWITHWQKFGIIDSIDKIAIPYGKEATKDSCIQIFRNALFNSGKKYSVVFTSHVFTTTGVALPLSEIAEIVHEHGALFVVDGAQAAGSLAINLDTTGADVYTVSAHKWMLAPTGSGLLYIRKGFPQMVVQPAALDSGYNGYSASTGTVPLQTISGLGYVVDMFINLGIENIATYNIELRGILYNAMSKLIEDLLAMDSTKYAGLEIISPTQESMVVSPIISLNLPPTVISNSDLCFKLSSDYGVIIKQLADYEGGNNFVINAIRITTHLFNSEIDIIKLINGLTEILLEE